MEKSLDTRMIGAIGERLWLLLACLLGFAAPARAQEWVTLEPTAWSAFVEFDGSFENVENSGSSRDIDLEEGIAVRQGGYILDPRIAAFEVEFEPVLSQGFTRGPEFQEDTHTLNLDYGAHVDLFQGPTFHYGFSADASRTTLDRSGTLGSRTETDLEQRSASVRWKSSAFPTSLKYSERFRDETFRSGRSGLTTERDDATRRITLSGRSSKTNLFIEREMFDDRVEGRNKDRDTNRARLNHRFHWGKGSRLNSNLNYFDRSGASSNRTFEWDERVLLQHTDNLSSTTGYRFRLFEQETQTLQHTGSFDLRHQLYRNLLTSLGLLAETESSELSERDLYQARLDVSYQKDIPWDGKLSLDAGGGYRVEDRTSKQGFLTISDEPNLVPASRVFLLNRRFIVESSIIITDAEGLIIFIEGADYEIRSVGGNLTEIRVLSGGQINVGDSVLANYSYEEQPSAKFYGIPYKFGGRLDFEWISVFHRTSGQEERLISGQDESILTNRWESVTGLQLRWNKQRTQANATAEWRTTRVNEFESDTLTFTQSVTHRLAPTATLNLGASQSFSEGAGQKTNFYVSDASLGWRPLQNLSVTPRIGISIREESGDIDRTERFTRAGLDLRWFWRKLEFDLRYDHFRYSGDVTGRDEDRIFMRLTRRF